VLDHSPAHAIDSQISGDRLGTGRWHAEWLALIGRQAAHEVVYAASVRLIGSSA